MTHDLSPATLKQLEQRIQAQLAEIEARLEPSEPLSESSARLTDELDRATQHADRQLALKQAQHDKQLHTRLRASLLRIAQGEYGYCQRCGDNIGLKRLEARPDSLLCLSCQSHRELSPRARA